MTGSRRDGFALLAVIWVITGVATLAFAVSLTAGGALATSRNRVELTRAAWLAEECLARARATISQALTTDRTASRTDDPWLFLDRVVQASSLVLDCPGEVALVPAGIAVDINAASEDQLRRSLIAMGIGSGAVDSMVDALLDWRDVDDMARARGAESEWYAAHHRPSPRNGPLAHWRELLLVRGFDRLAENPSSARVPLDVQFTAEPGRIVVELAPPSVLASIPGFTEETIARIIERRMEQAPPLNDLLGLGAELSAASRDSLHRYYSEIVQRVVLDPEAWIATAPSTSSPSGPPATIELRLTRAGTRAAITRRRSWP